MWHLLIPIFGTYGYVETTKALKDVFVSEDDEFDVPVKTFSIAHNAALAGFSGWTCVQLCSNMYRLGLEVQSGYYMSDPAIQQLIFWFYASKYYEYFDTFLLVAKGKTPIFLQKFHHIGAVFFWHLCYVYGVDAIVLGSIFNSGVHTIMYSYYLGTLFKLNLRWIKPHITTLQIAQLAAGLTISSVAYAPPVETAWNYGIILLFDGYIAALIWLFLRFMRDNYR
jgi:GNS1/SUR4 family